MHGRTVKNVQDDRMKLAQIFAPGVTRFTPLSPALAARLERATSCSGNPEPEMRAA